jgi:hypothetical protein
MKLFACILATIAVATVTAEGLRPNVARALQGGDVEVTGLSEKCAVAYTALGEKYKTETTLDENNLTKAAVCDALKKGSDLLAEGKAHADCQTEGDKAIFELSASLYDSILSQAECGGGLGAGAIAGIVIGVLVVVGAVAFFVMRSKSG